MFREIFDLLGVEDVTAKVHGKKNPYTVVYALFEALKQQTSYRQMAIDRGLHYYDNLQPYAKPPPIPTAEQFDAVCIMHACG